MKVGSEFSAIITENNFLVINEKNIQNYPQVPECNLASVQSASLKLFPDLAIWDIEALDAKVLGRTTNTPKSKFADHCQINETVLTTKSSITKNKKTLTTAFIFQNDEGELFTTRELITFPSAKDTSIQKAFEAYYSKLHGKKMHVILDRGNKNTLVSEYTSSAKNLPWCMSPSVNINISEKRTSQENSVFPISGFDGNIG